MRVAAVSNNAGSRASVSYWGRRGLSFVKNDKRKRGGAGMMVGHCSRIIHHSILYYSL